MTNLNKTVKVSIGYCEPDITMTVAEALKMFRKIGAKYAGRWENGRGQTHIIFSRGIKTFLMVY